MIELKYYIDARGRRPFERWYDRLDRHAAARITTALSRLRIGNLNNTKRVGRGLFKYRIDFGPGYRLYFGRDGNSIIVLLGGGTKARQQHEISNAGYH